MLYRSETIPAIDVPEHYGENIKIHNVRARHWHRAIELWVPDAVNVTGCTFEDTRYIAIDVYVAQSCVIADNTLLGNTYLSGDIYASGIDIEVNHTILLSFTHGHL